MGWYDWFSIFYDPAIARLYAPYRVIAADALRIEPGACVLDLPCGTGQSLPLLLERVEQQGRYVGLDLSAGMVARAQRRTESARASIAQLDVHDLDAARLQTIVGEPVAIDRIHVFLGTSAIVRWGEAFDRLWRLLRPGGRCVFVDVHADPPGLQGRMVERIARADLRRRGREPLAERGEGFERTILSTDAVHGGALWMACADKPARV